MSGNPIQFQFVAQKFSDETFHVLSFTATESISKTYQWEIDLISNDPALDPAEIVNFGASFRFSVVIDRFPIHGIVTRFVQLGRTHIAEDSKDHSYLYRAVLEPTLSRLALPVRSETFVQQSLPVLLKEILTRNRIEGEQVRYELKEDNYSEQWQTTQFEESDLHFLQRLCESEGIFYRFEQGEEEAILVLDDISESSPELARTPTLSFQDKSFMAEGAERTDLGKTVSAFSFSQENIPEKVHLSEYNWMHPGQRLKKTVTVTDAGGYGTFQDHRSHFFTEKGADFFARIRKEEILCRQNLFRGTSTAFTMRAGVTFTLTDHFNQNLNTEYLVTEVHHKGSQGIYFSPEDFQYENSFTAIRADIPFRPQRVTPVPRIEGVLHAHVDSSTGDTYADINEDGMYRVRFPFDITEGDKKDSKASRFVRMAQSYAGANMGMHFPLHKGTEVVIAFTGGDPDRPVIIGAVPNKETTSPVTSKNNTQSRIETPGGNTMIFEDQEGIQTIHMAVNKEGQQAFVRIGTLMPKPE